MRRYKASSRDERRYAPITRATRHSRGSVRLTPRGERLLVAGYTLLVLTAVTLTFVALLGLVGWIETGL